MLKSHQKREAQAGEVARYVAERFQGRHNTALYAVVGDFNDTPESPWVAPLINSPYLKNILWEYLGPANHWTYYWRSRNRVSQIDYILTSEALTQRIAAEVQNNPQHQPYIERAGLAFRELNSSGEILPKEANLIHFEGDIATPPIPGSTPPSKIPFRFPRYVDILDDWKKNVSDHCPVTIWF